MKCTSNSSVALGMRELQAPRNGDPTVGNSTWRFITPVGFGLGYLNKGQRDNTEVSSILSWSRCNWLLCVPRDEISIIETTLLSWYWNFQECDFRAEKAFKKWLPGMFPTHLRSLAEKYICTRELLRMKPCLFYCNILYFLAINLSLKHFESTTYYSSTSYSFIRLKTCCISS